MRVAVLGAPSSAGAYCVGVERAPAALRGAGLIEALRAGGADVVDAGNLTTRRWVPDRASRFAQNISDETAAIHELSVAAAGLLSASDRLLVLGGSCTVAVGLCAAMARTGQRPRIIYIDRHLDLNTPQSTTEGSLSWMGMAHALDLEGTVREFVGSVDGRPLLDPADLVYLGVDVFRETTSWEHEQAARLDIPIVGQAELCDDPRAAALAARATLDAGPYVVHLDVDVLDFLDAPIAENVNGRNSGPTIGMLRDALEQLIRDPDCRGMSIGQLDPAHASADPSALPRLVEAVTYALLGLDTRATVETNDYRLTRFTVSNRPES